MDNKNSWHESDIPRNDEPTRFLTKEEMEQLEKGIFEQPTAEKTEKKAANIKIEDLPQKEKQTQVKNRQSGKTRLKKYIKRLCLAIIFIAAGIAGFYLSFSWSLHNQSERNAKEYDMKQLEIRQQKLDEQQQNLEEEMARLRQEKDELTKQHEEVSQEKSFLAEIIDKFTGKNAEDRAAADDLKNKISKLEQAIDEVNLQMGELKEVKNQVDDLKMTATQELEQHKDVIDDIKYQIEKIAGNFLYR